MKTQCPNCSTSTELTFPVNWVQFACPNCQVLYGKDAAGILQQVRHLHKPASAFTLQLGQQGIIDDVLWEVGNICTKVPKGEAFGWNEYTLFSRSGQVCYLSEYNGHWVLATEIETGETFDIRHNHSRTYQDEVYPIFHNSRYVTTFAAGFFDHPLPVKGVAKDFVLPPKAFLLEKCDNEPTYGFEARHLSPQELKAGFPDIELPPRTGQGMLQPFYFDVLNLGYVLGAVGALIILINMFLTIAYPSYQVVKERVFMPDTVPEVTHISPSFTVTGIRAPLKIALSAPVYNSWAAADFCLVNEETKTERYGSVDVAYYQGVEGGESWTEGTSRPSIMICGVAPGRYHLAMQISKEANKPEINALEYTVTAHPSSGTNLMWSLGLLAVALLAAVLWKSNFEKMRWMYSDFPPESEVE